MKPQKKLAYKAVLCLMDGPPPVYIYQGGHAYMLASHAADQMLAVIENMENGKETERRA